MRTNAPHVYSAPKAPNVYTDARTSVETCVGRTSEVVRVGLAGTATTHIIFVPGNPGIPGYYGSCVEELAEHIGATAAVIGYLGHSSTPTTSSLTTTYGLDEQCEHVCSFIEAEKEEIESRCGRDSTTSILLIGHSIGAYVAFSAASRAGLDGGQIGGVDTRAIGLMPFLEHNELPEFRSKVRAATAWWAPALFVLLSAVAGLVGALPKVSKTWLLRRVERNASRFGPEMVDLTVDAIPRFDTLYNILALFRTEAQQLAPPYDHAALNQKLSGKYALLYAGGDSDVWAPSSSAERARAQGVHVTVEEGMPHAFSVAAASRERVVQIMRDMLESMPK